MLVFCNVFLYMLLSLSIDRFFFFVKVSTMFWSRNGFAELSNKKLNKTHQEEHLICCKSWTSGSSTLSPKNYAHLHFFLISKWFGRNITAWLAGIMFTDNVFKSSSVNIWPLKWLNRVGTQLLTIACGELSKVCAKNICVCFLFVFLIPFVYFSISKY